MNDLVEKYLNSIKRLLPAGQQDDIAAELADEIQSRIEDEESRLGRKQTPAEVEAILKSLGSPAAVAARYGANRYLIGPVVFPVYWLALRTLLTIVLFAVTAGGVIRIAVSAARGEPTSVAHGFVDLIGQLTYCAIFVVGFVTVVAVAIERIRPDLLEGDWLVERLSRASDGLAQAADRGVARRRGRRSRRLRRSPPQVRVEGAFGLVINLALFVWLAGFIAAPEAYPDYLSPDYWIQTTGLAFTPIWREQLFALVLAGTAARVILHLVMLLWPGSQRRLAAAKLLQDLAAVALTVVAVQAGPLFEPARSLATAPKVDYVLHELEFVLRLGFTVAAVVGGLDALYSLWRLVGPRLKPAAAHAKG
jgi:hypothetical protein